MMPIRAPTDATMKWRNNSNTSSSSVEEGYGSTCYRQCCRRLFRTSMTFKCTMLVFGIALAQQSLSMLLRRHADYYKKMPVRMTSKRGQWHGNSFAKRKEVTTSRKTNNAKMAKTNEEMKQVFNNENHTITLEDLKDLQIDIDERAIRRNITWDEAAVDRQPLLDILKDANLHIDIDVLQHLPTWTQITAMYGSEPVILGLDTCEEFRNTVALEKRYIGVAGQMNTGTNALSKYLLNNIVLPVHANDSKKRKKNHGILWTVPWYKHGWNSLKNRYMYRDPQEHDNVMPIIMVREPYFWMQSMCSSPYTLDWNQSSTHCPNLVEPTSTSNLTNVPIRIRWGKYVRKWESLAHVWSDWYNEYYEDTVAPRLFIRFEDLLFHTKHVINAVRTCVDAEWKNPNNEFWYQTAPAKTHPYFALFKGAPSSLISAMIKYGQDANGSSRRGTMTSLDMEYAQENLDSNLQKELQYSTKLPNNE